VVLENPALEEERSEQAKVTNHKKKYPTARKKKNE